MFRPPTRLEDKAGLRGNLRWQQTLVCVINSSPNPYSYEEKGDASSSLLKRGIQGEFEFTIILPIISWSCNHRP